MKRRVISAVRPFLDRHPRLMALTRRLRFQAWRLSVRVRTLRYGPALPDPDKTYWVDPGRIEYALVMEGLNTNEKYRLRGGVVGGDWDLNRVRFTELSPGVYNGLRERFEQGLQWEQTSFYRTVLGLISGGIPLWGCRTQAEWDERCRRLDSLYQDMKTNGYRTQRDSALPQDDPLKAEDEITVRVGRDGDLLFEDGQHRLAMAMLLNIESVPVKITARHAEWYRFRKEVLDYARSQPTGRIYHPVTHPDLADIPAMYGNDRFDMINANLPFRGGDLLDIGAHWGFFCHKFEEQGFNCYAVESHAPTQYFLKRLKAAENRRFVVIDGSIFDYRDKADFDVVLALNIFHHFLKTERDYVRMIELLKRLRMKVMFFQTELQNSPQMAGAFRNFSGDQFVDFILGNSMLREAARIGETEDGRPVYRLLSS